ncbi:MAG TPA: FAD binding domain-containing protein [Terriglobales bacterium]|nr:FAD binding domain-containing protein [Terriglobales bacterium]
MRAPLSTYAVVRPRDLEHALTLLHRARNGERLVPLAGGTDVYVSLNAGVEPGRRFLDLGCLRELAGIHQRSGGLTIGALTTFSAIRAHPAVRRRYPALAAAAGEIGAWQIQNRATLGGNIANASPAGDSLPVLLALEAVVHAWSVRGPRDVPVTSLFRGYRDLALEPDELIAAVSLPPPVRAKSFFRKIGTRRAQSISKVVLCGLLGIGRDGRVAIARVALGSVAPVTLRARHVEGVLLGARPSAAVAAAARRALLRDIVPIDDIRSDRDYRLLVAGNVLEQFLRATAPRFAH